MQSLKYCEVFKKFNKSYDISQIRYACVYLKNEAVVVDSNDNVYHFMNNGSSKIGKLCKKGVVDFAYSYSNVKNVFGYHILALTDSGRVYGWGRNNFKQVSSRSVDEVTVPERLKITKGLSPSRVAKSHLTQLNDNYHCCSCWPSCMKCQRDAYEKFKLIACGFGHCMAVTLENNIIVWGNNKFGQIGNGEFAARNPNVEAHKIYVIKEDVEPSWSFTGCFKASWLFCGQYIPSFLPCAKLKQVKIPKIIEIREEKTEIISIACGSFHCLVLFENGNVYGWGDNRYGQLGKLSNQAYLSPIKISGNIKQIASTNLYTLALSNDGDVYAMGDNTFAQLGNNEQGYYQEPIEVTGLKFKEIATINQLTIGQTMDDKFFIWGLYKMVKKLMIENDPNQLNEEDKQPGNNTGSNIGSNLLQIAAAVGVDQGVDAIIRSTKEDKPSSTAQKKEDPEDMHDQDKSEISEKQDQENEDEEEEKETTEEVTTEDEQDSVSKEENGDDEATQLEQANETPPDIDVMGFLSQAAEGQDDTLENEETNPQGGYGKAEEEDNAEKLTYIITKPTMVECRSFEKIIAKTLSLTNFTIKWDQIQLDPNEDDQAEIIDLESLDKKRSGLSSEMRRNIKILGQELKKRSGNGGKSVKVFFGDQQKFSVISGSYVVPKGKLEISNVKMTGNKSQLLNLKGLKGMKDGNFNNVLK